MKLRIRHCVAILSLVTLGLYLFALPNQFVWDDEEQIVQNQAIHSLANLPQFFSGSTFNSGGASQLGGLYYKPLMSATFALCYSIFGGVAWGFHLVQILLHVLVVLMLFLILVEITGNRVGALVGALVYGIHPLSVESVAYVSAMQETLFMSLGMFGLMWLVVSHEIGWGDITVAVGAVFLSMLGKETGVLFLPLILLYLVILRKGKGVMGLVVGGGVVISLYSYLRLSVAGIGLEKNYFTPMAHLGIWERALSMPKIVWHYLSLVVYPDKLSISQHWVVREVSWGEFWGPLAGVMVILGVAIYLGRRVRRREYWYSLSFAIIGILFHLQIFPLDMTVAERWMYLPLAGVAGMIASVWPKRLSTRGLVVVMMILLGLGVRAWVRIGDWQDGLTLYAHDQQIVRGSFDLENNLGVELYRVGDYERAREHFEYSTELSPGWWTNWNNLGAVVEREGELELAGEYYLRAIENGGYYLALINYGKILIKQERYQEAREFLQESLAYFPGSYELRELLGVIEN